MSETTRRPPGLYRRGGKWWAKWYQGGRPVRESTGTDRLQEAKRFLDARRGAVATGAPVMPRADRVVYQAVADDLRQHYATSGARDVVEAGFRLAHLDRFFTGRRVATIGGAEITAYVEQRQQAGAAHGTINRELATLSRMLRLAYENGKLLRLPVIRRLKEAAPRDGFFEAHQQEALRRQLPADLQAAMAIYATYGWRKAEVLSLERRHLDLRAGTLRLDPGGTKNDDGRVVYLTPELRGILAGQLERVERVALRLGRIVPFLFPHLGGRRAGQRRQGFGKRWATACRKAGVPGRRLHDFRRTAVRNLERAGVARSVAMKITGHKTESVYRRYAIVSDADLAAATEKLTGTIRAQSGLADGNGAV